MTNIEIKNSKIDSKGSFAGSDFKSGDKVYEFARGKFISKNEVKNLPKYQQDRTEPVDGNTYEIMNEPACFFNHSCDPNIIEEVDDKKRIGYALKTIKKGDELTLDYRLSAFDDWELRCNCGASNCQGVIKGNFFSLPLDLQGKYLQYAPKFIQEKYKLRNFFKNKKITIMGLGLLGRGVGDALFLAEQGAELTITDLRDEKTLAPSLEKLKKYKGIKCTLGEHKFEDFENKDFILKAAGVPLDSVYIDHAKKNGIQIEMDASLFCELLSKNVTVVGVTGTRGKSTTTHLIFHILKTAGKKVWLGGNVRDMATLPLISEVSENDFVVLELDSWQLQGFGDAGISPHVGVFTNFMPDHLNYYHGDLDRYFADKANIFKFQSEDDVIICGEEVAGHIQEQNPKGKIVIASAKNVTKDWNLQIPGEHNRANSACAIEVARALSIDEESIRNGVETFRGVEGRLQLVKEIEGVQIWNDNNATTPEATIAALKALAPRPVVLIMGGADKGIDMSLLVNIVPGSTKKVVLLPGTGTERLLSEYKFQARDIERVESLKEALEVALASATEGDALLFSPAFASFGPPPRGFKNEYERNDQFMDIVKNL